MKKQVHITKTVLIISMLSNCFSTSIYANDEPEKSSEKTKTNNFKVSTKVGSGVVQNEKTISSDVMYWCPAFDYSNDNGIYTKIYSYYYSSLKKNNIGSISLDLGYEKEVIDNLTLGLEYSYSRYTNSEQLKTINPHTLTGEISWFNEIIAPSVSYMYDFGRVADHTVSLDFSHAFIIKGIFTKKDKISIPITVGSFAGTTNYAQTTTAGAPKMDTSFRITSAYALGSIKYRIGWFSLGGTVYDLMSIEENGATSFGSPKYFGSVAVYF